LGYFLQISAKTKVHYPNKWGRRGGYLGEEFYRELRERGWPKGEIAAVAAGNGERGEDGKKRGRRKGHRSNMYSK
jgi:hypothetical protein